MIAATQTLQHEPDVFMSFELPWRMRPIRIHDISEIADGKKKNKNTTTQNKHKTAEPSSTTTIIYVNSNVVRIHLIYFMYL